MLWPKDQDSNGPETISVYALNDGVYRYSVYHKNGTTETISTSPAKVTMVINGQGSAFDGTYTATAPSGASGQGDIWVVWDITVSGGVVTDITPVNIPISSANSFHP
jgi:archaellum component FlaG (FlaF/FlaG flagellin family)